MWSVLSLPYGMQDAPKDTPVTEQVTGVESGNRGGEASTSSSAGPSMEPHGNEHTAKWRVYTTLAKKLVAQVLLLSMSYNLIYVPWHGLLYLACTGRGEQQDSPICVLHKHVGFSVTGQSVLWQLVSIVLSPVHVESQFPFSKI